MATTSPLPVVTDPLDASRAQRSIATPPESTTEETVISPKNEEVKTKIETGVNGIPTPPQTNPSPPSQNTESEDESSDDNSDEDYDPPSWDGIKRRKRRNDGKIRPAYYYPTDNLLAKGVPVFEPTMEEFKDFYKFITAVDSYGMKSGIVKVVPPKEWSKDLPDVSEQLKNVRLRNTIDQNFLGQTGLYRCTNVAKGKYYNALQWKQMTDKASYMTPDFFNANKAQDTSPLKRSERFKKRSGRTETPEPLTPSQEPENEGSVIEEEQNDVTEVRKNIDAASMEAINLEADMEKTGSKLPLDTPVSESVDIGDVVPSSEAMDIDDSITADSSPTKDAKKSKVTPLSRADISDEEWEKWHGQWNELPHGAKKTDYTVEACHEIERRYWRTLLFGEPPKYGADLKGSLFTDETKSWNVAHLDNLFTRMKVKGIRIPGVNTPYLYFGMWRATFAWHVEDADLYSINYIHFGAPKFWYAVPQENHERFERTMAGWFPNDRTKCPEFLRHKSFLASPLKLAAQNIPLNRCVQLPGEFILTYPYGYHSGFNLGFNCAESINFATETWVEIGRQANYCHCIKDSVTINVDEWLEAAREEASRELAKRKRPVEYSAPVKRIKIAKAERLPPPPPPKVCVYCPDLSTDTLVPLARPPTTEGGESQKQENKFAHRACVGFIPTTYLKIDDITGEELAYGYDQVEKARWKLNCAICPDKQTAKYGAKIQCTKSDKCFRAYHVTCALAENSGVFIDMLETIGDLETSLLHPNTQGASKPQPQEKSKPSVQQEPKSTVQEESEKVAVPKDSISETVHIVICNPPEPIQAEGGTNFSAGMQPEINSNATKPGEDTPSKASISEPDQPGQAKEGSSHRVVLLCRQHNPEWIQVQKVQQAAELEQKVEALAIPSFIKVRASGGIYRVTLLENFKTRSSVRIQFEDRKQAVYRYSAIFWGQVDDSKLAKRVQAPENPYAKEYNKSSGRSLGPTYPETHTMPTNLPSVPIPANQSFRYAPHQAFPSPMSLPYAFYPYGPPLYPNLAPSAMSTPYHQPNLHLTHSLPSGAIRPPPLVSQPVGPVASRAIPPGPQVFTTSMSNNIQPAGPASTPI